MKLEKKFWKKNHNKNSKMKRKGKKKKSKIMWITIVMHNVMGVGWTMISPHLLIFGTL